MLKEVCCDVHLTLKNRSPKSPQLKIIQFYYLSKIKQKKYYYSEIVVFNALI